MIIVESLEPEREQEVVMSKTLEVSGDTVISESVYRGTQVVDRGEGNQEKEGRVTPMLVDSEQIEDLLAEGTLVLTDIETEQ